MIFKPLKNPGPKEILMWADEDFARLPDSEKIYVIREVRRYDRQTAKAEKQVKAAKKAAKKTPKPVQKKYVPNPNASPNVVQTSGGNVIMDPEKLKYAVALIEEIKKRKAQQHCQENFLAFCKHMFPPMIIGEHHRMIAEKLEDIANGKIKRLIINMPPRMGKSFLVSEHFIPWLMGKMPNKKILQATHTAELSERFGRKVRNMIQSDEYKTIFPGVNVRADSKASGRWEIVGPNKENGEAYYTGIGGKIAGRGADVFIIDDPVSEQDLSDGRMESVWDWYLSGPRQRLQPGAAIILVMTRWSKRDLTEKLLKQAANDPKADQWEQLCLPAILSNGQPLWPEWFSIEELEAIKASNFANWQGQYMQDPTSEEAAILKRDWWQIWENDRPPPCEYVIQAYDTAYLKDTRHDYTAITTWGIFYDTPSDKGKRANIILLNVVKDRFDFPELKKFAIQHYREWNPDLCVIEAKASGLPLIQELRAIGILVADFTPSRGNDKIARANAIAPIIESGLAWIPDVAWAWELVEELASFPNGEHDDLVDSTTLAFMRFRQGGFIQLYDDEPEQEYVPRAAAYY